MTGGDQAVLWVRLPVGAGSTKGRGAAKTLLLTLKARSHIETEPNYPVLRP